VHRAQASDQRLRDWADVEDGGFLGTFSRDLLSLALRGAVAGSSLVWHSWVSLFDHEPRGMNGMHIDSDPGVRAVAFAVLLHPDPVGTEHIEQTLRWDSERVRQATDYLQGDGLLTHELRPTSGKRLFRALSDVWCCDQPEASLASAPNPGIGNRAAELLMLGLADLDEPGGRWPALMLRELGRYRSQPPTTCSVSMPQARSTFDKQKRLWEEQPVRRVRSFGPPRCIGSHSTALMGPSERSSTQSGRSCIH
jgi:hypothetical protein